MNKRTIWIIIAVALVAVLGVAGWKWHEQPTFCSAVCHKVMTPYVESWQGGDMLAATHAKANIKCLDCHEPTISQQLSEVGKYITGNYKTPLPESNIGTKEFCFKCHGTYAEIAEKTEGYSGKANPHDSHEGALDCNQCHRVHGQSQLLCAACHGSLELPAGWKAAVQSQ